MKKTLAFSGSILYSLFMSLLIYFAFFFISGWILSLSWLGFIMYSMIGSTLIIGIVVGLSSALSVPLIKMVESCKNAKWIPLAIFLFYGYRSCAIPWTSICDFGLLRVLESISIDIFSETLFVSLIFMLFHGIESE